MADTRPGWCAIANIDQDAVCMQYFVERCNWELAQRLKDSKQELAGMKIQERVRTAIQWRLEMQIPYMGGRRSHWLYNLPGSFHAWSECHSQRIADVCLVFPYSTTHSLVIFLSWKAPTLICAFLLHLR